MADYQEVSYGKNKVLMINNVNPITKNSFSRHAYLLFEEEGYMLESYIGDDVPEVDLEKVLANISLEATTKELASSFVDYDQYQIDSKEGPDPSEYKVVGLAKNSKQLAKIGESIRPSPIGEEKGELEFTVKKVEVRESIENLNPMNLDDFSLELLKEDKMIDETGRLLPYERTRYSIGNGKTTVDEVIEKQKVEPKFVYLTVIIENKSDRALENIYFQNNVDVLVDKEDKWMYESEEYQNSPSAYRSEPAYLDSHGEGKSFYKMSKIEPQEKRTVQVGYFVDEDQLSNMFLSVFYMGGYDGKIDDLGASDRWWVDIRQ